LVPRARLLKVIEAAAMMRRVDMIEGILKSNREEFEIFV